MKRSRFSDEQVIGILKERKGLRSNAPSQACGPQIGHIVDLLSPTECANHFAAAGYDPDWWDSALSFLLMLPLGERNRRRGSAPLRASRWPPALASTTLM
jgi:hypothetical protein